MADNRRIDFVDPRKRADFRAVLNHYGLRPKGKGDQVKIACPFHDDVEPSCLVNLAERRLAHEESPFEPRQPNPAVTAANKSHPSLGGGRLF
jgi:hypothetical protein